MLNNGICAICKTNKWTILCPECSRPLCSDCVKDLDGYHRCERCLNKDLKRGEQYSHAVYTVLKDERTKEQFGNLFWDMVETMFESLSFDTDGMLHYLFCFGEKAASSSVSRMNRPACCCSSM